MEVLSLCYGTDAKESSGYFLGVCQERKEPGYDSRASISLQRRASKSKCEKCTLSDFH